MDSFPFSKNDLIRMRNAKRITAITGAGISSESGIPTFRGEGGLWRNYRAEDLATPEAFAKNPDLVWEWYDWRREICANASPNPGHLTLAKWETLVPDFTLITQNVDGLHPRAGSKNLYQIHGNIFTARCLGCGNLTDIDPKKQREDSCSICRSKLRPHILWFGETYESGLLESCFKRTSSSDLILIIGTSANVSVPASMAKEGIRNGALSIEINPERTSLSNLVDYSLQGKSGEILPKLLDEIYK